jgi:flagellar protein FlbD
MTLKDDTMIMLSRLNGLPFALNPDLIERAEATPDTVLTLCDGNKLVIGESVEEVVTRVRDYRASILSLADQVAVAAPPAPALHVVVPLHGREA